MRTHTLVLRIVALAVIALLGSTPVHATDYTFDNGASTGDWHTAANWNPTGVPNSVNDTATIPTGYRVALDANATVGALEIHEDSFLQIAVTSSATFTVDRGAGAESGLIILRATSTTVVAGIQIGSAGAATTGAVVLKNNNGNDHQIGGWIILDDDTSILDIEDDDVTFAPYSTIIGSIFGEHNNAKIELNPGRTLASQVNIVGKLVIQPESGTATLDNQYVVEANAAGTLALHADLILLDLPGAIWTVRSNPSASLQFNRASSLDGDVVIDDCATVQITADLPPT
jgi:hypothetical protein